MPLQSLNNYNDFEFCLTPDNPAIRQARKDINAVCIPRAEQEDKNNKVISSRESEYHTCVRCLKKGIVTRYLKSTMLIIECPSMRNGRKVINKRYYCEKCAEIYIPHSERVGYGTY